MKPATLLPAEGSVHDTELLRLLIGRRLCSELQVLAVIGAHRLDELPLIERVFPALRRIYVFEPLEGPLVALRERAARDARIEIFALAVAEQDGSAEFHISSNDGESSSLLDFGTHRERFPGVSMQQTITVPIRRLDSLVAERGLEAPDVAIVDVQGAELQVLRSFGPALRARLRLLYTEVSTEPLYSGSGLLADVEALLAPRLVNLGFAPINAEVTTHGNAVFVAQEDVAAALAFTWRGRLREWARQRRLRRRRALRR